tara:strand:+ start:1401 stop:4346 length:2946 start_codon:yes stop_codon:yes gene_type:complete
MNYLNTHSRFSLMGGLNSPEELLQFAQDQRANALALTDTNGLYGVPEFLEVAREYNVRPIVGVEIRSNELEFSALARNRKGYEGLCLYLTKFHQSNQRIPLKDTCAFLANYLEDLVFFSSQKPFLLEMKNLGASIFFEMSRGFFTHRDVLWAKEKSIELLANNKVHYIHPNQAPYYQALRAIDGNTTLDQVNMSAYHNHHCHMWDRKRFESFFAPYPTALENNKKIKDLVSSDWFFNGAIMPDFNAMSEEESDKLLRKKCEARIKDRYDLTDSSLINKVHERLDYELEIISHKSFSSYFLNVEEMASFCEYTCGRGSSAASIVNYLLHITHVDPIGENLLFDRFMNVDRQDPPDIDVDFPWDQRDDVLDAIFEKHKGRAAMVANHNYLRDRSALREMAKVFGIKDDEISYTLDRLGKVELNGLWIKILHYASQVEGVLRHLSVHCGGVVVTPDRIDKYVPVEMSKKGYPVIQWEKDQTEAAGLVKTDILGNRGLAVIRDVINSLRFEGKENICYQALNPQSDPKTQKVFIEGQTVGVTHFESPRCRTLLKTMKDAKLSTLSIICSIIRPAAMVQVNELIRRFHGGRFRYLHPKLEKILGQTFGVMVYQEDVMRVSKSLAGFTSQEGNELRKVLAKKSKNKKLQYYKNKFFKGCEKEGLPKAHIEKLWYDIESFAGYSFCKPHSDSYSLVSFKSAYLKAHYPAQFMAATISNQGGFYVSNVENYLNEARRMGVVILPPDINLSDYEYTGREMEIRTGLKQLKGVTQRTIKKIISQRELGDYRNLEDFLNRVNPAFHEAKTLVKARCFSSIRSEKTNKLKNSQLMWMVYEHFAKKKGSLDPNKNLPVLTKNIKEFPKEKLIYWEQQCLDGFITFPSWFLYRDLLKQRQIIPSTLIKDHLKEEVILYGQTVSVKGVRTKHEQSMAFITFSDDDGMYNTTLFPNQYEQFRDLLQLGGSFLIKGKVEKDFNDCQIVVSDIKRVGEI